MSDFTGSFSLSELDGTLGFAISGIDEGDRSGISVSDAGDINGDGIDDIIIGASANVRVGREFIGESYVIFGSRGGFSQNLDLSTLDGRNGFVISGLSRLPGAGFSVSGAGDFNSDGIDDLIVGSGFAAPDGKRQAGESYIIFGSREGFDQEISSSTLDGSNGLTIEGENEFDYFGYSVSDAGDINGDGIDDLIIGAYGVNSGDTARTGQSYVIFGSGDSFDPKLRTTDLDSSNGFVINGVDERAFSGYSVSGAGDVNGDRIDDIIIGTQRGNKSYVVFGAVDGFSQSIELSDLNGDNGFLIEGSSGSVSGVGDINGDGFDDVAIGGDTIDTYTGGINIGGYSRGGYLIFEQRSYVVFGFDDASVSSVDLLSLDGDDGFDISIGDTLDSRNDYGRSIVSGAGDINGDGFDDVIVGLYESSVDGTSQVGKSYIVFGASDTPSNVSLNRFVEGSEDGSNGFDIAGLSGDDNFGQAVSAAGDVNGDGIGDLIIGAPGVDTGGKAETGQSYVVFGRGAQTNNATIFVDDSNIIRGNAFFAGSPYQGTLLSSTDNSTIADDVIAGTEGNDNIWAGTQGNDSIDGNGGNDIVGIGNGNATVITRTGDDFVYSITNNSGNNTIELGEGNNNAWLLGGNNTISAGAGRDVIGLGTGSDVVRITGGNNVIYKAASGNSDGNKDILTGAGDDYMELGTGDDLINAGGGLNTLFGGTGADTFVVRRGAYNFLGDFELGIDKIELAGINSNNLSFFQGTGEKANNVFGFVGFEAIFEVVDTTVEQIQMSNTFV